MPAAETVTVVGAYLPRTLHFEMLLEDWCRQIEHFLEESLDKPGEVTAPGLAHPPP